MAQSDDEDDYMNMVFEDAPKSGNYETALQRAARKRKEVLRAVVLMARNAYGGCRGRPKPHRRPKRRSRLMLKQRARRHSPLPYQRPTKDSR